MCKIRNFNLEVPIIQGGMGVGVSLGGLAGAVARQGAMGVISSVNAGYREEDFRTQPLQANLRALKQEIAHALKLSDGNGMVAVNIMVAVNHYEETVQCAIESGVHAIISGAGLALTLPSLVGDRDVAIAPIVSSGKAARVILKAWSKAGRLPDFIVIEGPLAGGHLGFKKDEILENKAQSVDRILADVLAQLSVYEAQTGKKIPCFVAGGIFDGSDMARVMAQGASGVQIATRFIATQECDASPAYKQMMVQADAEDVVIVPSPVGLPGRALRTPLVQAITNGQTFPAAQCNLCLKACPHGDKIPYCISHALIEAVKGNIEEGLFFCGANVGRIHTITTVAALISEIMQEYEAYIKKEEAI
ncbi:MAG: NAD(P)H-dependent flavin oxidoreductase [Wujia sp.]